MSKMTVTVAYPSDPVVNGATLIQSSTFIPVAADYEKVSDWSTVQRLAGQKSNKLRNFPLTKTADPTWIFFVRNDLTGGSATDRNLLGIQLITSNVQSETFSATAGGRLIVPNQEHFMVVNNWYPKRMTLTSGEIVTRWHLDGGFKTFMTSPEDGNIIDDDVLAYRALEEALGFLQLRVAAGPPTMVPATNVIGGSSPLG
jgi:hypothetical protein